MRTSPPPKSLEPLLITCYECDSIYAAKAEQRDAAMTAENHNE